MAQFMLRDALNKAKIKGVTVRSFGLNAKREPLSDGADTVLSERGIKTGDFFSKPVPKSLKAYDAVVCMTRAQAEKLKEKSENAGTVGDICGTGDVGDPFGKGLDEYRRVSNILEECCKKIVLYIKRWQDESCDSE